MKETKQKTNTPLVAAKHDNTLDFVGLTTIPRDTRLPINRCNLPSDILGGLTFQQAPSPLELDGVKHFHSGLFKLLDQLENTQERIKAFILHMNASFYLQQPEQAGFHPQQKRPRHKADYLRVLRGWSMDSDSREGAVLKGWVESRFGLLPRYHAGQIRDFSGDSYRLYLEMRAAGLYGTNALEAQFDLLYSYSQYELRRAQTQHLTLYRGINRIDDYETLAILDNNRRIILLNNINSFSRTPERADEFGDCVISAKVPAAKVFCYSELLPRLLRGEDEVTVIGGLYEVTSV